MGSEVILDRMPPYLYYIKPACQLIMRMMSHVMNYRVVRMVLEKFLLAAALLPH